MTTVYKRVGEGWQALTDSEMAVFMMQVKRGYGEEHDNMCERCGEVILEYKGKGRPPKYCNSCSKHKG